MSVMRRSSSEPLRSVPRETANKTVVVTSMRRRVSSIPLLLFLLLAATLPRSITSQQPPPCNMCQQTGGEITNPNKIISVPGFEFIETCEALQAVLSFIGNETAECALVQSVGKILLLLFLLLLHFMPMLARPLVSTWLGSIVAQLTTVPLHFVYIGTICGCSRPPNACDLCPNGADVTKPDRTMPFLANLFNDIVPTCELAQAYMESSFDQNSDFCAASPALLAGYCGCPNVEYDDDAPTCTTCIGEGEVERNRTISIPGFPFETCGQLDDAVDSVIKDGSYECELVQTVSEKMMEATRDTLASSFVQQILTDICINFYNRYRQYAAARQSTTHARCARTEAASHYPIRKLISLEKLSLESSLPVTLWKRIQLATMGIRIFVNWRNRRAPSADVRKRRTIACFARMGGSRKKPIETTRA